MRYSDEEHDRVAGGSVWRPDEEFGPDDDPRDFIDADRDDAWYCPECGQPADYPKDDSEQPVVCEECRDRQTEGE